MTATITRRTELFVAHGEATSVTLALAANGTAPTTVAVPVLCHSACARPVPASHTAAFHWKHTKQHTVSITYSILCTLVKVLYCDNIMSNKYTRHFASRKFPSHVYFTSVLAVHMINLLQSIALFCLHMTRLYVLSMQRIPPTRF